MIESIQHIIDHKTKPIGSLAMLEEIAAKICLIQQSEKPELKNPTMLVFAADHGIAKCGVSAYPQEVTSQMVLNFLNGGAAINVFCKQHGINLKVIDAGVNYEFDPNEVLVDAKIAKGTANMLEKPAMTEAHLINCFEKAEIIVKELHKEGCNVVGFGEMGIGNTSSASLLMSSISGIPLEQCAGKGAGLNDKQLSFKINTLLEVQKKHDQPTNAIEALQYFGGFEIAQMCGAMLAAYDKNMLLLIDGFIAGCAYLCAFNINPAIKNNALSCHLSDEKGHALLLNYLGEKPVLNLGLRLGEGTGCALAYPIIESAVRFMNEMASFENAGVTNKK